MKTSKQHTSISREKNPEITETEVKQNLLILQVCTRDECSVVCELCFYLQKCLPRQKKNKRKDWTERKKEKYKSIHLGPFLPFDRLTDRWSKWSLPLRPKKMFSTVFSSHVFYLRKTFGHNDPEEKKNSDAIKTEKKVWKKKKYRQIICRLTPHTHTPQLQQTNTTSPNFITNYHLHVIIIQSRKCPQQFSIFLHSLYPNARLQWLTTPN